MCMNGDCSIWAGTSSWLRLIFSWKEHRILLLCSEGLNEMSGEGTHGVHRSWAKGVRGNWGVPLASPGARVVRVPWVYMSWSKGCEGYLGCTGPGAREQGMWGVPGVYRSWSKGSEEYLGCTGPGARDVRGTWGVQVLEQGMWGVPGVYRSWSKGCEGCLGCTGPGARDVRDTWGVQVPEIRLFKIVPLFCAFAQVQISSQEWFTPSVMSLTNCTFLVSVKLSKS